MKNMKRLLAVLLAVLMCLSCLAGLSFADNSKRVTPETELPQTTLWGRTESDTTDAT